MNFDDVNYEMYNKYIFSLNPQFDGFHEEVNSLIGTEDNNTHIKKDNQSVPLTSKQLTSQNYEQYSHSELDTKTEVDLENQRIDYIQKMMEEQDKLNKKKNKKKLPSSDSESS